MDGALRAKILANLSREPRQPLSARPLLRGLTGTAGQAVRRTRCRRRHSSSLCFVRGLLVVVGCCLFLILLGCVDSRICMASSVGKSLLPSSGRVSERRSDAKSSAWMEQHQPAPCPAGWRGKRNPTPNTHIHTHTPRTQTRGEGDVTPLRPGAHPGGQRAGQDRAGLLLAVLAGRLRQVVMLVISLPQNFLREGGTERMFLRGCDKVHEDKEKVSWSLSHCHKMIQAVG
ncbi:uncharacterized protein LOC107306110 isoform X2 [Coturnix japonica]|uniref:uncharacterized protein LOC107306110 isoform X2 n=1 Tax=Coturnix japonica TaxID=93934 RepID=UPI00077755DF|nr:uncharacterized protein LOC107306110 isoform X2 [Coturnix japonica]